MEILKRFHNSVMEEPNTGCWLWSRPLRNGYGLFSISKKTLSAHRVSFMLYNGEIPLGIEVCHSCDIPSCVNPQHLFLGTHKQNMDDRDKKGRVSKKSKHYRTSLDELQVLIIRDAHAKGFSNASIGRYFKVSRNVIWYINNNWTWR